MQCGAASAMENQPIREAVRKRPGMYVGDVRDGSGANHVVFELVANALDQFLAHKLTRIEISIKGHELVVMDDGPGLPFRNPSENQRVSEAAHYLENAHDLATADRHAPHVHIVTRGVGLAVINALCSRLEIRSSDRAFAWSHSYERGIALGLPRLVKREGLSGTRLKLRLDEDLMAPPHVPTLKDALTDLSFLFPGFSLILNGITLHTKGGLAELARNSYRGDHVPSLWHREQFAEYRIDLALLGSSEPPRVWRSWANGVETVGGGSHDIALSAALEEANWTPAVRLVHIIMETPNYAGPRKDRLDVRSIEKSLAQNLLNIIRASQSAS